MITLTKKTQKFNFVDFVIYRGSNGYSWSHIITNADAPITHRTPDLIQILDDMGGERDAKKVLDSFGDSGKKSVKRRNYHVGDSVGYANETEGYELTFAQYVELGRRKTIEVEFNEVVKPA